MNPLPNRRVLLIDDMPSIHEDFRKILAPRPAAHELDDDEAALFGRAAPPANEGFDLDTAYQGREGVAMAQAAIEAGLPYALAFVDMRMPPGWSGVETIEHLWRADPRLQVVICTAYSDHAWEEVLARLDVRDRLLIVKKPFDLIEVSQLAKTLTAKWNLARQAALHVDNLEKTVQELRATEVALRRSNEDLEGFAHSVSHDLRSPMAVMSAFSTLLARELKSHASHKALHYLSRIQASAVLGEQLIEGLLSLTRIARAQLCVEPVDLGAVSRRLLDEHGSGAAQRQVSIVIQDGLSAEGDLNLVRLAMRHLLDNAWKFTSQQARAEIEVGRQDGADGETVFFVRDNGAGFDMAYAGQLFKTFQRLHAADEFPGIGLGMVTASRIFSRHGGRIWADSRPGEGATFYFTLPCAGPQRLGGKNPMPETGATP